MDPNGLLEPASVDATNNGSSANNNDNASAMQLFAPDPNGGENVSSFSVYIITCINVHFFLQKRSQFFLTHLLHIVRILNVLHTLS